MAIKPIAQSDEIDLYRGTGTLGNSTDYLKADPATYYYQKFKGSDNKFLNDTMWTEAAKRGETGALVDTLSKLNAMDASGQSYDMSMFNRLQDYPDRYDYDAYMLALSIPTLDDTNATERKDELTGYSFGTYTDRGWATEILNSMFDRYDAQIVEEHKANRSFWQGLGEELLAHAGSFVGHLSSGFLSGISNIMNLAEGIGNIFINYSNDEDLGDRFLWAFQEDRNKGTLQEGVDYAQKAFDDLAYRLERDFSKSVNAVAAYEAGYKPGDYGQWLQGGIGTSVGAGYNTWGRWWSSGVTSFGNMIPSMLVNLAAPGTGTAVFYTQIFSENITDTLNAAKELDLSYKDLNAGEVVFNSAIKSTAQWAVEVALAKVLGFFSTQDKMLGLDKVGNTATKTAVNLGKTELQAAGSTILRGLKSMGKEGLEEVLQDMSDGMIDWLYSKQNTNLSKVYETSYKEKFTFQNLIDSFVVGALTEGVTSTISALHTTTRKDQRGIGVDEEGKPYRLGFFQTLNLRNSFDALNNWNDILHDNNATAEAKRDAAARMSVAMNTVGDLLKNLGTNETIKVNQILNEYLKHEDKKAEAQKLLSSGDYATKLFDTFVKTYEEAKANIESVVPVKKQNKIKQAFNWLKDKLVKSNVTKVDTVITTELQANDPNSSLSANNIETFKARLKELGAEAIVGVDGNIVAKSGDVIVANSEMLLKGDLAAIVQGVAYQQVEDVVTSQLSQAQKDMILSQFNKATGSVGTLSDAIKALLFDKQFYTKMLLLSEERHYQKAALNVLATIDKVIKGKASTELQNGRMTMNAFNTLMAKVYKTMQTGLITYATQYSRINLGDIDNAILSPDLKELIKTNKNVIFSNFIDESIKSKGIPTEDRLANYRRYLAKFNQYLSKTQMAELQQKAASSNINERTDAYIVLAMLAKSSKTEYNSDDKLIYLPITPEGILDQGYIRDTENYFGVNWTDLLNGNYDASEITPLAKEFIFKRYDMSDRNSRYAAIREILYNVSKHSLSIGSDGTLLRVLDKTKFAIDKYIGENGDKQFRRDLQNAKINTIADITKLKNLPKDLTDMKIVISDKLQGSLANYEDGSDTIYVAPNATLSNIMHEVTHATQYMTAVGMENSLGGNTGLFKNLPQTTINSLEDYIAKNFPMSYQYLTDTWTQSLPQVVYYMLEGELRANSTMSTYMFDIGFTWNEDRSKLISPDGKIEWSMKASKDKVIENVLKDQRKQKAKAAKKTTEQITMFDTALGREVSISPEQRSTIERYANKVSEDVRQQAIRDVNSETFYRGESGVGQKLRAVEGASWHTNNPDVAKTYFDERKEGAKLESSTVKVSNPLVIDFEGKSFSDMPNNLISDHFAVYARQNGYDSAILLNIVDPGKVLPPKDRRAEATKPSTDLIIFEDTPVLFRQQLAQGPTKVASKDEPLTKTTKKKETEKKETEKEKKPSRYISNKEAAQSNLKYFMKKGVPIQMDPNVKDFIVTTTHDFDMLSKVLQQKIKDGTLNKFDIIEYIATTANIKNYDFKQIAKYVYKNEELSKLDYKEMNKLIENLETIVAASAVPKELGGLDLDAHMTPDEMITKAKNLAKAANTNPELEKAYSKAIKYAENVQIGVRKDGSKIFTDVTVDPKQLNPIFFRHYDGTPRSIRDINALGKDIASKQHEATYDENIAGKTSGRTWNYQQRKRTADNEIEEAYDYRDSVVGKALADIDRTDKINAVEDYIRNTIAERIKKEVDPGKIDMDFLRGVQRQIDQQVNALHALSDAELNQRYLNAIGGEMSAQHKLEPVTGDTEIIDLSKQPRTTKNIKDQIRNLMSQITRRISGLKNRYNQLSDEVKQYFNPDNNYKRISEKYATMSDAQLEELIPKLQEASLKVKNYVSQAQRAQIAREVKEKIMSKLAKKNMSPKGKEIRTDTDAKKTLKQKVQVEYKTEIKEQTFEFVSPMKANETVEKLLNTNWDKTRMSTVQGLTNNREENIANGKKFFEQNAETLLSADLNTIEDTTRWFLSTKMNNVTDAEYKKFAAIKMYFLGYVYGQTGKNGIYENMNANLKQQIENTLKAEATVAGTMLSVWNNIKDQVDPLLSMRNADMELDGVLIPTELKAPLFDAIDSNNIEKIKKAQQDLIEYVESKKTNKKSIYRKIVSVRAMSMLSSPLTWLRNKVSNFALKRLNKLSSAIGNRLFKGKTQQGQIKLNKQVTPEIQNYITKNFIDNKFFDNFAANLSKYNPSDITDKYRTPDGKPTKEAIMSQLVLKSMYNEYYNRNMFKHKFMNEIHQWLMQRMSDDSYVREAAIRYFGKILAEKGYDLSDGLVTNNIMNDFSTSLGLALSDYMHSDNFFNTFEKTLSDKTQLGWFAYKTLLPFASASWNWFKAAAKLTPFGLAKSLIDLSRLESRVAKAEADWQLGKTNVSPELKEYMIRRDIGAGVIGTIAWGVGMILAGLGYISLEDDDYGTPKLRIGNLSIDISSIFGSSSVLAGAALITGIKDERSFLEGLNRMTDVLINDLPLMQIVEMDMYSKGGFSMGMDQLESIALSFIPNILSYIAGGTYTGKVKKNNMWERAIAKIPFMANMLEKQVDPYTGKTGSYLDALNRIIPYFSLEVASQNERKTNELGLTKKQLRGSYTINDETFTVKGKDLTNINKAYGKWNAEDLTAFYDNQMKVKVKIGNKFSYLSYNQMTNEQRKNAVQSIMSNNANLAKIMAWTSAGNKYYASAEMYSTLMQHGIKTNVYRGTKGFVKK